MVVVVGGGGGVREREGGREIEKQQMCDRRHNIHAGSSGDYAAPTPVERRDRFLP